MANCLCSSNLILIIQGVNEGRNLHGPAEPRTVCLGDLIRHLMVYSRLYRGAVKLRLGE